MLHNLIFSYIVLVDFFEIFRVICILMLNFSSELSLSIFFRNFETTGEAASIFIQKFGDLLMRGVLNLILHMCSHFGNFALWVYWTHTKAREG
jgi:hypothetical protein